MGEDCRWAFDEKIGGGGGWLEEGMTGNPSVSRYPIAPPDTPPLCVNSNFKRLHHPAAAKYCLPAPPIFLPAFNYKLIIRMMRRRIMKIMMKGEDDEYDIQESPSLCGSNLQPSQATMQCL